MDTTYQEVHDEAMADYRNEDFDRPDPEDFIDPRVTAATHASDVWDDEAPF